MGLFRQMIGRVLRPAPGKTDAIVLDHSGAVFRHGFAEDHVEWTLDPDRPAKSPAHEARGTNGSASRLLECSQCGAVREGGKACFHCGFLLPKKPQDIVIGAGELGLVEGGRKVKTDTDDPVVRTQWLGMLAWIARERGFKAGWIAHTYREKFNAWPPYGVAAQPIMPTPEVRRWVKSRWIAYSKGRRSA
jgi:hypothetical protein